jgi:hypothetical protein
MNTPTTEILKELIEFDEVTKAIDAGDWQKGLSALDCMPERAAETYSFECEFAYILIQSLQGSEKKNLAMIEGLARELVEKTQISEENFQRWEHVAIITKTLIETLAQQGKRAQIAKELAAAAQWFRSELFNALRIAKFCLGEAKGFSDGKEPVLSAELEKALENWQFND